MRTLASEVQCPLCGASATQEGVRSGYTFHRCDQCLLLFAWPLPQRTLDIYSDDYFRGATAGFGYVDYDLDKQPMQGTFGVYLDRLEAYLQSSERVIFDIGAATGFFLDIARQRGWEVSGVEPSAYAAARACEKGIPVETGVFENCQLEPASLDAVTMWDVIEHLPDPRSTVRMINRTLKQGGLLAINTPDSGSLMARLLGLRWHLVVPPEHLMLFHRKSLRCLLESEGFEILAMETIGKRFSVQYILQTLAHWQQVPMIDRFSRRLQRSAVAKFSVSLNLRDNVTVFARKR